MGMWGRAISIFRRIMKLIVLLALCAVALQAFSQERKWLPLGADGIRDPKSPAIKLLQQPAEALSKLPPDTAGNQVRWVKALEKGYINPRTNIFPETKVNVLDLDILLDPQGSMPIVRFPHKQHTEWLDCASCHEKLFKSKAGSTKFSMLLILSGEQCGVCHGAVAFPLTECSRCHSVPRPGPHAMAGSR